MSDQSAILQAILADPADDLPRLAYADWLEEHGEDAHAEFIRVQIAGESNRNSRPRRDYFARARDLLHSGNVTAWFNLGWSQPCRVVIESGDKILVRGPHFRESKLSVRRGFVRKVNCFSHIWENGGSAIVAHQPVEKVELINALARVRNQRDRWFFSASSLQPMTDYLPARIREVGPIIQGERGELEAYLSESCLAYARAQLKECAPPS